MTSRRPSPSIHMHDQTASMAATYHIGKPSAIKISRWPLKMWHFENWVIFLIYPILNVPHPSILCNIFFQSTLTPLGRLLWLRYELSLRRWVWPEIATPHCLYICPSCITVAELFEHCSCSKYTSILSIPLHCYPARLRLELVIMVIITLAWHLISTISPAIHLIRPDCQLAPNRGV